MEMFVEKVIDRATDSAVKRIPGAIASLDAVQDLKQFYRETGTAGWMHGKEWRHVASIHGPVMAVAEILDPEFLNGNHKRNFYSWLDQHPGFVTYDRRKPPPGDGLFHGVGEGVKHG